MHRFIPLLLILLSSCAREKPAPESFTGLAMTMPYHVMTAAAPTERDKIKEIIAFTFATINATYNKWNPDSELSMINKAPAKQTLVLSPALESFLHATDSMVTISNGRFDPTIETIQGIWKESLQKGELPRIPARLIAAVGWNTLTINQGSITKEHHETQIDLGGIAKGLCVDLMIESLNAAGFPNCYVEWGGEIRTSGMHPAGRPWKVAISKPGSNSGETIAELELKDQAIATSGDYFQQWRVGDEIYFHIINPVTCMPLKAEEGSICSATVVAPTCAIADALATTAMLFPCFDEAKQWAVEVQEKHPEVSFWLVRREHPRDPEPSAPVL